MPDVRPGPPPVTDGPGYELRGDYGSPPPPPSVTIGGVRGEVLAYIAEHLNYLDEVAARTNTPRASSERFPRERLEHLEGLVKTVRAGVGREGIPSPYYLRSLAAQCCAWLEELRERGEVSW